MTMQQMPIWAAIIIAVLGGGGLVGLIAYLVAPASERLAFKRKDRDAILSRLAALEIEVRRLTISERFLTAGVTALIAHSDEVRGEILKLDPGAQIKTAAQVLIDVRANLDGLGGGF